MISEMTSEIMISQIIFDQRTKTKKEQKKKKIKIKSNQNLKENQD